jgi:flagellar hook-associated protein 1 FlgK
MGDILGNALSGLLTFQRALTTTSHNIANVNTEGYSRQRIELDARNPYMIGDAFIGNGVEVVSVSRAYDQLLTNHLRSTTSAYNQLAKVAELAGNIDNILADPEGGLSPILQDFFNAVQDLADQPTSGSARQQLISTAESMVNRLHTLDSMFASMRRNIETEISNRVVEINQFAEQVATINGQLFELNSSGNLDRQSADLLDQRDAILQDLSELIGIQVINEPGNLITVQIGNGQTMVTGTNAFSLDTVSDPSNPTRSAIVYSGFSTVNDISEQLSGGILGGVLEFSNSVLEPTISSLGRIAIGLADSFNQQHNAGMDLLDNLGGDFFSFEQPSATAFIGNSGSATVDVEITDLGALTTDEYILSFDGSNWSITSESGNSQVVTSGDEFEGLTLTLGGTAVMGDSFSIRPTERGASSIGLLISDPNQVAAAAPIRTGSALSNLGSAELSAGEVVDSTDPALLSTVNLTFNDPPTDFTADADVTIGGTTYLAGTSIPFANNMQLEANGWRASLSGAPAAGDVLTIEANFGGSGDNRNALALSQLQTEQIFDNGLNNFQEAYGNLVGLVGSRTSSAMADRDAQEALLLQAEDRRAEVAGVNLDEEAADLIKYQQAYQAAARMISTAQELFTTLLDSTR